MRSLEGGLKPQETETKKVDYNKIIEKESSFMKKLRGKAKEMSYVFLVTTMLATGDKLMASPDQESDSTKTEQKEKE